MRDEAPDSPDADLACTALLYASGELDEADALAFDRRLAEDQSAREALCQAVELNLALTKEAPAAPDPAYRQRVRARLQQRRRHLKKMAGAPTFWGQPAMWSAIGAGAAVILMLIMHHFATTLPQPPTTKPQTQPAKTPPEMGRAELQVKLNEVTAQADRLVQELSEPGGDAKERAEREARLRALAGEMIDLHIKLLRTEVQLMDKELADLQAHRDQRVQQRYEELLKMTRGKNEPQRHRETEKKGREEK